MVVTVTPRTDTIVPGNAVPWQDGALVLHGEEDARLDVLHDRLDIVCDVAVDCQANGGDDGILLVLLLLLLSIGSSRQRTFTS